MHIAIRPLVVEWQGRHYKKITSVKHKPAGGIAMPGGLKIIKRSSGLSRVRDCLPCAPVTSIKSVDLSHCWYSTRLRAWSSFSPLIFQQDTRCSTDTYVYVAVLVTEALLLRDHGTVYLLICDRWPAMDSSGDIWNRICLGIYRNHSACMVTMISSSIQIHLYLLTYLLMSYKAIFSIWFLACVGLSASAKSEDKMMVYVGNATRK